MRTHGMKARCGTLTYACTNCLHFVCIFACYYLRKCTIVWHNQTCIPFTNDCSQKDKTHRISLNKWLHRTQNSCSQLFHFWYFSAMCHANNLSRPSRANDYLREFSHTRNYLRGWAFIVWKIRICRFWPGRQCHRSYIVKELRWRFVCLKHELIMGGSGVEAWSIY